MKTVLLVDDEKVFLSSLKEGLQSFGKRLRVLTARDGKEAIGVLARTTVHLVVTDLNMPGVDGMALLAHMSRKHPKVPAIVMTAYGSPETEQKVNALGALRYIEKPIDFKETARLVFDVLELPTSYIRGIGVPSFAQLIEVERKTCIVRATSYETPPRTGVLHFVDGELVHAEIGALSGAEAAYEILAWGEASLELEELLGKAAERTIHAPLANLVMQSLVIADQKRSEAEAAAGEGAAAERPAYEAPKLEEEAPAAKETEAEPADDGRPTRGRRWRSPRRPPGRCRRSSPTCGSSSRERRPSGWSRPTASRRRCSAPRGTTRTRPGNGWPRSFSPWSSRPR